MNNKNYKEFIEQIHVDETKKQELKNKIYQNENKFYFEKRKFLSLAASFLCMVLVITGGICFEKYNMLSSGNELEIETSSNQIQVLDEYGLSLKTLEDKQMLLSILEKNYNETYRDDTIILDTQLKGTTDSIAQTESVVENTQTNSTQNNIYDYSKTNVQVEGIDEADIVKVDENYIYYLSMSSNKVIILDKVMNEIIKEIDYNDELENKFYAREMFASQKRLIIIGCETEYQEITTDLNSRYQYDTISKTYTTVFVYNTENQFKKEREVKIEGNYFDARLMNGNMYFITRKGMYYSMYKNRAIEEIENIELEPSFKDSVASADIKYQPLNSIYYFEDTTDSSILNIASFSIKEKEEVVVESFFGAGNNIYMSENNLYIARRKYEENINKTEIYKIKIDGINLKLIAKGSVTGNINNQFSMDEYNGNLRIATTAYEEFGETTNQLYILDESLNCIGKIENMAKGEKIYSVRFFGKLGYVVTFKEVDPLFVIDLSDAKNPQIKGELKIPGYSSYLHVYDENHVLGIGNNTKSNGRGGITTDGMKMSMFDVSDLEKPKEKFSLFLGKNTYSLALYNHKSILFSKEKNIIAFPINIESWEYGAVVYNINIEEKKFEQIGFIEGKDIERIIYVGNKFYTFEREKIQINPKIIELITD